MYLTKKRYDSVCLYSVANITYKLLDNLKQGDVVKIVRKKGKARNVKLSALDRKLISFWCETNNKRAVVFESRFFIGG